MADFDAPQSRNEAILQNMLGASNDLSEPQSRIEQLLLWLLERGGIGGVVGDSDVSALIDNKLAPISEILRAKATMKNVLSSNDGAWVMQLESEWGGRKDSTQIDVAQEDLVELKIQSARYGQTRTRLLPTKGYVDAAVKDRYSVGEELLIGEWIDGNGVHDLYRKVVDFGALTNATQKTVAHGISSPFVVTKISGVASTTNNNLPIPLVTTDPVKCIYLAVGQNYVTMTPASDRSNYNATVIIEYYKSTV